MIQILAQPGQPCGQKSDKHTRGKARCQRPAKAAGYPAAFAVNGGAQLRKIPAHKPRHKGGGIPDAAGDKRRQHRVDHRHGCLPDGVQHNSQFLRTVQVHNQHSQRHADAARHDKGYKVRYTVHQMAVKLVGQLRTVAVAHSLAPAVDLRLARKYLFQQLFRLTNGLVRRGIDHLFAHKPRRGHRAVDRDDDAVGFGDLGGGQLVFHAARAVGLDFYGNAVFVGAFFQRLGSHIGVRQPVGAGGDSQQPDIPPLFGLRLRRLCVFFFGNAGAELLRRLRRCQCAAEVLVHQQPRQRGQHTNVQVVFALRCGDQKQQVNRLTVRRGAVDRFVQRDGRQRGLMHRRRFGVRHSQAVAHTYAALRQPRQNVLFQQGSILHGIALRQQAAQRVHGGGQVLCGAVQPNMLRLQKVGDLHGGRPPLSNGMDAVLQKKRFRFTRNRRYCLVYSNQLSRVSSDSGSNRWILLVSRATVILSPRRLLEVGATRAIRFWP